MSRKSGATGVLLVVIVCGVVAWCLAPVSAQEPAPAAPQAQPQYPIDQSPTTPPPRQPVQNPDERRMAPRPIQRPADEGVADADQQGLPFVRASRLMHAKVTDPEGDHIGKLDNLAINTQRGQVVYGVLGTSGFLRMGQKKFAVPWMTIEVRTGDRVVVDADKQQLKRMAGFRGNNWPATADASFYRGRGLEGEGEYAQAGAEETGGTLTKYNAKGSDLVGRSVLNLQGDKLGTIRDLVIDQRRGRIQYAVIASGGLLRIGDRLLPVPWKALDTQQDNVVRLDTDQARMETAPTFSNDDWSALTTRDFVERIHAFYGRNAGRQREERHEMQRQPVAPRPDTGEQRDIER